MVTLHRVRDTTTHTSLIDLCGVYEREKDSSVSERVQVYSDSYLFFCLFVIDMFSIFNFHSDSPWFQTMCECVWVLVCVCMMSSCHLTPPSAQTANRQLRAATRFSPGFEARLTHRELSSDLCSHPGESELQLFI